MNFGGRLTAAHDSGGSRAGRSVVEPLAQIGNAGAAVAISVRIGQVRQTTAIISMNGATVAQLAIIRAVAAVSVIAVSG